jgi:hypothetical protein
VSATDITVDTGGNAYLTGRVHGGVCTEDVNAAALVAKLDPTGGLAYAASLGGSLADTSIGQAIAVDAEGHAYVAGVTSSHDFPVTAGAFRTQDCSAAFSAGADGFVAKLSTDGTTLEYSTFLCGTAHESLNGIAVDAAGSAYVVGSTESKDFPSAGRSAPSRRPGRRAGSRTTAPRRSRPSSGMRGIARHGCSCRSAAVEARERPRRLP